MTTAREPFRVDVEGVEIEDGVRQEIRALAPVRVPVMARDSSRVESDVQSNRQAADGRVYAFVLDDLHTHPLRSNRVKGVVRQCLDRHFGANDLAPHRDDERAEGHGPAADRARGAAGGPGGLPRRQAAICWP